MNAPAKSPTKFGVRASELSLTEKDGVRSTLANVITIVRRDHGWRDVLAFNERSEEVVFTKPPPFDSGDDARPYPRAMGDVDAVYASEWGERRWKAVGLDSGISADKLKWFDAMVAQAKRNKFDPVRDYLGGVEWDGVVRLSTAATTYFGATMTPFACAAVQAWMISAVARTFEPACQADHVLILEGKQGSGKSTALATLAGEWFADSIAEIGSKDAALGLCGAWIIELAELDTMRRADVGSLKAFISRRDDRFRAPYGRVTESHPRRCVFAGSTNDAGYLRDASGARRFWPIACGTIDLEALRRDRDQLWAEAVSLYRAGEPWHLTDHDVIRDAVAEQAAREEDDVWDSHVARYLVGREYVSVSDVLAEAVHVSVEHQKQADQNRVARILLRFKWWRARPTIAGIRTYVYVPPRESEEG